MNYQAVTTNKIKAQFAERTARMEAKIVGLRKSQESMAHSKTPHPQLNREIEWLSGAIRELGSLSRWIEEIDVTKAQAAGEVQLNAQNN